MKYSKADHVNLDGHTTMAPDHLGVGVVDLDGKLAVLLHIEDDDPNVRSVAAFVTVEQATVLIAQLSAAVWQMSNMPVDELLATIGGAMVKLANLPDDPM